MGIARPSHGHPRQKHTELGRMSPGTGLSETRLLPGSWGHVACTCTHTHALAHVCTHVNTHRHTLLRLPSALTGLALLDLPSRIPSSTLTPGVLIQTL